MIAFNAAVGSQHTDAKTFRKFLEEDDGGEFVVLNCDDSDVTRQAASEIVETTVKSGHSQS